MMLSKRAWIGVALPMLSAILVALSGSLSRAQAPTPFASRLAPGQVMEVISPAAAVVSTAHYQVQLALTCAPSNCQGNFPNPGPKRRLNVTRITCLMFGAVGTKFAIGRIELRRADNSLILQQSLPVNYTSPGGSQMVNRAVDVQVSASRHISVFLSQSGGSLTQGWCTATGTLDTLG